MTVRNCVCNISTASAPRTLFLWLLEELPEYWYSKAVKEFLWNFGWGRSFNNKQLMGLTWILIPGIFQKQCQKLPNWCHLANENKPQMSLQLGYGTISLGNSLHSWIFLVSSAAENQECRQICDIFVCLTHHDFSQDMQSNSYIRNSNQIFSHKQCKKFNTCATNRN